MAIKDIGNIVSTKLNNAVARLKEIPIAMARITSGNKRAWTDDWPETMDDYGDVYEKVSLVRKCINLLSEFSVSTGWILKTDEEDMDYIEEEIKDMQTRTNFAEMLKIAIKKREIWGFAAFEIVTDPNDNITSFNPLNSTRLTPILDDKTLKIKEFEYRERHRKKTLSKDEVFYVTKDSLDASKMGTSALESIKSAINRKWQLEKDLLESSKRLWAPYTLFAYDTTYVKDKDKVKTEMSRFKDELKPGNAIVHNKRVEPTVIDMKPDINSLNAALEDADKEIMGNWGIPKALVSRDSSANRSSLEFSIRAMYESTVKGIQQYFAYEIEQQIYSKILEKHDYNSTKVSHIWKPVNFQEPPLIRSLTYAVKEGVISPRTMIEMLNWPPEVFEDDYDDEATPREDVPVEDRPVTMQDLEALLDEVRQ